MRAEAQRLRAGVLLIEISGPQPERLLNLAVDDGVDLRRVRRLAAGRLQAQVTIAEFRRLRPLARQAGCCLKIRRRHGLPFVLAAARRRPLLPLAALLFIPLLAFCCSIVSSVSVSSPDELSLEDERRVYQLAEQAGLKAGRSRWRMELEQAEQAILSGFPQLFYVEIFERGNALEIKVVRRIDVPPEQQIRPPGDVVALAAGVVRHVLVERGTARVSSGETVRQGQVLISGEFAGQYLGASGLVTAFVFGEGYGECYERETALRPTGRGNQQLGLAWTGDVVDIDDVDDADDVDDVADAEGRGWLLCAGAEQGRYLLSTATRQGQPLLLWRKIALPVELVLVEVAELDPQRVQRQPQQARQRAQQLSQQRARQALDDLGVQLCQPPRLDSQALELGDGVQRVHTVAQALADIGGFVAVAQPAPAEPDDGDIDPP